MQEIQMHDINCLISRAKNGDATAEDRIFKHLLGRFILFAFNKTGNMEIAREIAQETCTTIIMKYKTTTFTGGFEEWAWGVLRVKMKNYFHQLQVGKNRVIYKSPLEFPDNMISKDIEPNSEMIIINCLRKVGAVNRRFARILNLIYQGFNTDEICKKMKLSRSNCYSVLSRGRAMLKTCLDKSRSTRYD